MHPFLADARAKQSSIIASIRELVECESPSDHPKAVNQFVDLVAAKLSRLGGVRTLPGGRFGKHLQCDINLTDARASDGQILVLGHSDTVWPLGTLESMPFLEKDGRLCGPGVLDMKAGIAFFIAAIETLRELNHPVRRKILLQLNADEEMGSESSRSLTEAAARQSAAVLVLEPGTGLEGRLKTARKGTGNYSVTIQGRAAHAGLDFEKGANAIVELARQIERIAKFTDVDRGLTVNA